MKIETGNLWPITQFEKIHKGQPCVILGNGPSLVESIPILEGWDRQSILGLNASLSHIASSYYIALDGTTAVHSVIHKHRPYWLFSLWRHPLKYKVNQVVVPQAVPIVGKKGEFRPVRSHEEYKQASNIPGWSNDLRKGIFSCRTTIWFGLQLACWMGYNPIYVVGWDLSGTRPPMHYYEGKEIPEDVCKGQYQLMGLLKQMRQDNVVRHTIYNCSPYNKSKDIPKVPLPTWEKACKKARKLAI